MRYALLIAFCLATAPVYAQRHLPATHIFDSPGQVLIDTRVEAAAVYSGGRTLAAPSPGNTVEFQIFAPLQAGQQIFGYSVSLVEPATGSPTPIGIRSVRNWEGLEHTNQGAPTRSHGETRLSLAPLPRTGHICTVVLEATDAIRTPPPLQLELSLTVAHIPMSRISRTLARVNRVLSRHAVGWM